MGLWGRFSLFILFTAFGQAVAMDDGCASTTAGHANHYKLKFGSEMASAEDATAYLKALYEVSLRQRNLPDAEAQMNVLRFGLVMQEMTINAVHHGNHHAANKFMWLSFSEDDSGVNVAISDESGTFFNAFDPNERVNQLRLRAQTDEDSADTDGLAQRRLDAGHALEREGQGGRGIFLSQQMGATVSYLPHLDSGGNTIGTTVNLHFPREVRVAKP